MQAQSPCPKGQEYMDKMKNAQDTWTPDQKVRSNCIQGWSQLATWHVHKCQCELGLENQQDADNLVKMMNHVRNTIQTQYPSCGEIPPLTSSCKVGVSAGGSGGSNNRPLPPDPNKNVVLNDEYMNLIGNLAQDSKNPHFKEMASNMQRIRGEFSQGFSLVNQLGGSLSKDDIYAYNLFENIAQGIEIGKFLFKSLSGASAPLTPEQQAARDYIKALSDELKTIYQEVSFMPNNVTLGDKAIEYGDRKLALIEEYDRATATRRLLFMEYFLNKPYMGVAQLEAKMNEIERQKNQNGVDYILQQIAKNSNAFKSNSLLHIQQKEEAFKNVNNRILLQKAIYYERSGDKAMAEKIRKSINYNVDSFEAFKLLHDSYKLKDYYSALQYYDKVRYILEINENKKDFFIRYSNIPNLDYDWNGLDRNDAVYLIALGVLSNLNTGDLDQARSEMEFMIWYNENYRVKKENYKNLKSSKKYNAVSDSDAEIEYNKCMMIQHTIQSIYYSIIHQIKDSKFHSTESLKYLDNAPSSEKKYDYWIKMVNLENLIRDGEFAEARKIALELNRMGVIADAMSARLFTNEDFKFLLAYMKYAQKEYESAVSQLKSLNETYPNNKKVVLLLRDTYLKLGKTKEAEAIENAL